MNDFQKKHRKKSNKAIYRKWHRRIGLSASLFLLILAVTGILLNHFQALSLDKNYIQSSWLLDWYGVKKTDQIECLKVKDNLLCQVGDSIYNATENQQLKEVSTDIGGLINLYQNGSDFLLISYKAVQLFTKDFQLIDSLSLSDQLTESITTTQFSSEKLLIKTVNQTWLLDIDSFELTQLARKINSIQRSSAQTSQVFLLEQSTLKEQLALVYRQQQISYLKFVQDLHSGQLFSLGGKLIADLVALCIILLAISGFITWTTKNNSSRSK